MSESGRPRSRVRVMFDAIDLLRDEPEVIVIRRQPTNGSGVHGHWVISTAGHTTHHHGIDLDAEIMIKVLMRQQEEAMP